MRMKSRLPAVHLCCARGGCWFINKPLSTSQPLSITTNTLPHFLVLSGDFNDDDGKDEKEYAWKLAERWKFDEDDSLAVGPQGPDVVDDYEARFL